MRHCFIGQQRASLRGDHVVRPSGSIDHALTLYRRPLKWRRLPLQTMSHDFSSGASAAKYVGLYRQMLGFRVFPKPLPHQAVESTSEIFAAT